MESTMTITRAILSNGELIHSEQGSRLADSLPDGETGMLQHLDEAVSAGKGAAVESRLLVVGPLGPLTAST